MFVCAVSGWLCAGEKVRAATPAPPPPKKVPLAATLPTPGSAALKFFAARVSPVAGVGTKKLALQGPGASNSPSNAWDAQRRHLTNDYKQKVRAAQRTKIGSKKRA